jgi:hypothetical protein
MTSAGALLDLLCLENIGRPELATYNGSHEAILDA